MSVNRKRKYFEIALFIGGLVVILIFFLVKANTEYHNQKQDYLSSIKKYEKNSAYSMALLVKEMINPAKELTYTAARRLQGSFSIRDTRVIEILKEKSEGFSNIGGFYFGRERDGKHLSANTNETQLPKGYDPRKRPWYKEAVEAKNFIITDSYRDALTGKQCVTLAKPVYRKNTLAGVVGLDIFIDTTERIINKFSLESKDVNFIINDKEEVISSNTKAVSEKEMKNIVAALEKGKGIKEENSGAYCEISELNWKVVSMVQPSEVARRKSQIVADIYTRNIFYVMLLYIIILSGFGVYVFYRKKQLHETLIEDTLTGIPNRYFLEEQFPRITSSISDENKVTFLFMDVDNFKIINDTYGHVIGDQVLKKISSFLKNSIRSEDLVIRLGSDEFAIIMFSADQEIAREKAVELQNKLYELPFEIESHKFDLSVSIGVIQMDKALPIHKLLSLADAAINAAKRGGKNKVVVVSAESGAEDIAEMNKINRTINLIKNSLKEERFELFLQPIYSLETNKVKHYEALARIRDAEDNILSPAEFINVAENYGLIHLIDKFIFDSVIDVLKLRPDISIFFNVSPVTLNYEETLEYFARTIIQESKSRKLNIGIEITESSAIRSFNTISGWIKRLKAVGCSFSLDDFGVGYTSFSYLRELQADYVKIDGSFVKNMDTNSDHKAIVEAITRMSKSLGKEIVAEFVETKEVMEMLKEMNVDYAQGYYYSKPISVKEILL